jgi:hypothetical protein
VQVNIGYYIGFAVSSNSAKPDSADFDNVKIHNGAQMP